MLELTEHHGAVEFAHDWDATLETLVESPVYYWFPQGLRIEGKPAVREMYRRIVPVIDQMKAVIAGRTVHFTAFGDSQLAAEVDFDYRFPDGAVERVRIFGFIQFVGEKMLGETAYVDSRLAAELDRLLDDEFRALPGVMLV